jgi:predicted ribosome quality control (RQC) complex YloA/Tae2 family protein
LDFILLEKVVSELAVLLPGSRIDKVIQGNDDDLFLVLYKEKKHYFLLLSLDRTYPRIHLVTGKPAGVKSPSGFSLALRKHLIGNRLQNIGLVDQDRVVELRFSGHGGTARLIFELTGFVTNLILTDDLHKILSVHQPVLPGVKVRRPIMPGLTYQFPEAKPHRATMKHEGLSLPGPGDDSAGVPVNKAVEAWFDRTRSERQSVSLRSKLSAVVRTALARAERRCLAVEKDVAGAERAEDYRLAGELIVANKHLLSKGQGRAELPDYDGKTVAITLDPARTPADNAERYFKRYKKARAGLAVMQERLRDAQEESEFLKTMQKDLASAGDDQEVLGGIRTRLSQRGYIGDEPMDAMAARTPTAQPYTSIVHEGWTILVGKSAAGNDYIIRKLARPDDLWLHAEGMPGSHVVVRNPEKRDIPEGVLRKAAGLAAYHSKGRGSSKVAVAYTRAANVKKPKGAAPGLVILTSRKTFMAAPESG